MAVGDLINFKYGTLSQIKQASLNNNTISISTDTGTIWLGNTNITSRVIDSYLSNNTLYISKISDDGTLSSEQVDLNFARFSDLPVYSAGSGIDISNGEISVILDTDVFEVVESLPTQNISTKKIYLVSNGDTSGDNMYNEWHYLGHGAWEILGSKNVGVNLRDYYTKTEIDAKGYLTSHQDITGKQNILTVGNGIDITNDVISCTLTVPEVVSELTNDAGYISTETDPTVPSYVKGITQADITNWNNKADNALLVTLTGISSQNDQGWDDTIDGIYFTTDKTLSEINSASKVNVLIPAVIASQFDLGSSDIIVYPDASDIYQFFRSDTLINGYFWGSDGGYGRFYVEYIYSFVHKDAVKSDIDLYGGDVTNEQISNGWWVSQVPSVSVTYRGIQTLDNKIHRELSTSYISSTSLNTTLASYVTSGYYDTTTRKIYLRHGTNVLSEIDANDFIKDGMVDTAYVDGSSLVISFNTDAGKQPVHVPIEDIFDPSNYYTKTDIDNAGYISTETDPIYSASPAAGITSTDISTWNSKTDNVGTITGITMNGSSKGTSGVVDLGTVVTSETDPIYSASAASGITASDISNWNSKTDNVGTITGITMNNTSKGTSGVVDLGTVITSETQLSKGATTGNGNAVTDITVSNHEITLTKGSTFLTAHQDIKTINNNTLVGTGNVTINELPTVSSTDNGKILQVVNGTWSLVSPITLYSGTGTPNNSQGNNGDLYMQI